MHVASRAIFSSRAVDDKLERLVEENLSRPSQGEVDEYLSATSALTGALLGVTSPAAPPPQLTPPETPTPEGKTPTLPATPAAPTLVTQITEADKDSKAVRDRENLEFAVGLATITAAAGLVAAVVVKCCCGGR